jgi:GT2 family glycosyltransferase
MSYLISILVPTYNTPVDLLNDCVESVLGQTSNNWELCLVDDGSTNPNLRHFLESLARDDKRIRLKLLDSNVGIVGATNHALSMAKGDFVALLDHDDLLEPDAIETLNEYLERFPLADVLYTDEYHIHPDGGVTEFVKPDWSPERLRSQMYMGHLCVVRTSLAQAIDGFRQGFDGSQDHDFILRATEVAQEIVHIPVSLYYWRVGLPSFSHNDQTRKRSFEAGLRAVNEHLVRVGINANAELTDDDGVYRVRRRLTSRPLVSVVIPTRGTSTYVWGRYECLVVECVRAISQQSTYQNLEFVIVADLSTPTGVREELEVIASGRVKWISYDRPFNFSDKVNLGVACSSGQVILLLNDDTRIINADWCEPMLELVEHDDVGIVGNLLLFPNSQIQHAGHRYVDGAPTHHGFGSPVAEAGPASLHRVQREVSGVSAACAMLRRDVFGLAGGLTVRLPNNFNDVDLNLKVRRLGYSVLWTPNSRMFHFESATRNPNVQAFEHHELLVRWYREMRNDPYDAPVPGHLLDRLRSTDRRKPKLMQSSDTENASSTVEMGNLE